MSAPVWVCDRCDETAAGDPTSRGCGLPRGWEHRDPRACTVCVWTTQRPPAVLAAPVCGTCIAQLLDDVLAAFARAAR